MNLASTTTLFVDNLTVIDFSYLCPEQGIVGESWIVDLQLSGALDQQGMIFDFGHVKKKIKAVIDHLFDHKLVIPTASPSYRYTPSAQSASPKPANPSSAADSELHSIEFKFRGSDHHTHRIRHCSPASAICELPIHSVTPDSVLPYLKEQIQAILPDNVEAIELNLRIEETQQPYYQYSHGLQFHDGDCQRIAHGHRSRLEVRVDGQRCHDEERAWCQQWRSIYIATERHIVARQFEQDHEYLTLRYQAQQGLFELTLPSERVHIIQTDTTVELIARHIAQAIADRNPGKSVTVKAYEGVKKGAIATVQSEQA